MRWKIFSVFDVKTEAFSQPAFLPAKGQALRVFGDAVKNPQSEIGKHPEDYSLYEIGVWDDQNCRFELYDTPLQLCTGFDWSKQP